MKLARNKIIILSLFIALANLFALGCFFIGQSLHSDHHQTMSSMKCCTMGAYNETEHAGYNFQYNISNGASVSLNLILFSVVLALFILKETKFSNYYLVKDRYGGFKLLHKFLFLFKTGILHPKIY